jgi:hypothetical protein
VSSVLLSQVGTFDLLDLEAVNRFYGRDFLPFPFRFTHPSRFTTHDEAEAYTNTVPDRYHHGDLKVFAECAIAYSDADIRVECRVQYIPSDTPCARVLAYRARHLGFLGVQHPNADVIDIYTISPYDLGSAITEAVSLKGPGTHSAIVIPEYVPRPRHHVETDTLVIREKTATTTEVMIPSSDITAYSTVQSHWRPTRNWGPDPRKKLLRWIRIKDDGDYLYTPDSSHAKPMTKEDLRERIDRLIADDITALRNFRSGWSSSE